MTEPLIWPIQSLVAVLLFRSVDSCSIIFISLLLRSFFLDFLETICLGDYSDIYSATYTPYTHYPMLHYDSRPYEKNCKVNTILKWQKGNWHRRLELCLQIDTQCIYLLVIKI